MFHWLCKDHRCCLLFIDRSLLIRTSFLGVLVVWASEWAGQIEKCMPIILVTVTNYLPKSAIPWKTVSSRNPFSSWHLSLGIYRPTETRNEGKKEGKDIRMRREGKETMGMITAIIAFLPQFLHTSVLTVCHWVTVFYNRKRWTTGYCSPYDCKIDWRRNTFAFFTFSIVDTPRFYHPSAHHGEIQNDPMLHWICSPEVAFRSKSGSNCSTLNSVLDSLLRRERLTDIKCNYFFFSLISGDSL